MVLLVIQPAVFIAAQVVLSVAVVIVQQVADPAVPPVAVRRPAAATAITIAAARVTPIVPWVVRLIVRVVVMLIVMAHVAVIAEAVTVPTVV